VLGGALVACPDTIEQGIIRAYVQLVFAPRTDHCRTVTLGWLGSREMRLAEIEAEKLGPGVPPFWIEVFCHARNATVDGLGCHEFDDYGIKAAVELIMGVAQDWRTRSAQTDAIVCSPCRHSGQRPWPFSGILVLGTRENPDGQTSHSWFSLNTARR